MDHEAALAWSLLDTRPNFYYHSRSATYICYWNGVVMTKTHAISIMGRLYNLTYPNVKTKDYIIREHHRAFRLGAFGPDELVLDESAENHYHCKIKLLTQRDKDFLTNFVKHNNIKQVLQMFKSNKQQVISD